MYVVSYDISNDKVRAKIAKELENFGRRVQYSVFECRISEKQFEQLYGKLTVLMQEEKEGNVRIYKLCGKCERDVITIGIKNAALSQMEEELFII